MATDLGCLSGDPLLAAGATTFPVYSPRSTEWFPGMMKYVASLAFTAALILWAPGGLRATCYYYRKAIIVGFHDPARLRGQGQCVMELTAEKNSPLMQKLHRFFMYLALDFRLLFYTLDLFSASTLTSPKAGPGLVSAGQPDPDGDLLMISFYTWAAFLSAPGGRKLDSFSSPLPFSATDLELFHAPDPKGTSFGPGCSLACLHGGPLCAPACQRRESANSASF